MEYPSIENIPLEEYPLLVFADNNNGFIQFLIKARTDADYSHVMWSPRPGFLASQGFTTYSEIPLSAYIKPHNRLKFVGLRDITPDGRQAIINSINEKLHWPWYKKMYDWVGIVGQALPFLKWINIPWLEYCSEDAPTRLRKAFAACPEGFLPPMPGIIKNLPLVASPQQLNVYLKDFKDSFPTMERWEWDDEN